MTTQPFGTWHSPISASIVATQGLRLGAVSVEGDDIYWVEGRPAEGGRNVVVRRDGAGRIDDLIPPGFNARTRVHEYGGGMYAVANRDVYFCNFADQRIYRVTGSKPGEPQAITPAGDWFYADAVADVARRRLICVREDHTGAGGGEPVNALVTIPLNGSPTSGEILASGYDFYSTPRLSPDGSRLTWLCWRHPQMPWDGTELWLASVSPSGGLEDARRVAGGNAESIYQPGWSPGGGLYFVSDRDGWWRLYRMEDPDRGAVQAVLREPPEAGEFGQPQWILGTSTWAFAGPSLIVAAYSTAGRWRLATIDAGAGTLTDMAIAVEPHDWIVATPTHAITIGGRSTVPDAVVRIELSTGSVETIKRAAPADIEAGYLSEPEAIEFATGRGQTAHAFYYPPRHVDCAAPPGDRPPLIVISHGGPTTAASATYDLKLQYWTSRGFAVVDVNYGGSSGFGRAYRQRLNTQWGLIDVEDCVNAARHLVKAGKADPERLIIRGGSAGGYTTLAALTFYPDVFNAGASYYGISDIEVLARDTHKFESRYLDTLVGPYPEAADEYKARSPIHYVDNLSCPLILFQGLEDKVVPPNQSQMMADAVRAKGLPVAYLTFEGEQHGFRKADTIVRCLEAELFFYGAVFGFTPADRIEPVAIANL